MSLRSLTVRMIVLGIILGSVYGVSMRWVFGAVARGGWIMTVSFLIFASVAIGYLTISHAERVTPGLRRGSTVFLPWLPILISTAVVGLFKIEGLICIAMALPITLTFASVGGIAARLLARRTSGITTACVAILPFLLAPIETQFDAPVNNRRVDTQIAINAPAERVWTNIERVPLIHPSELRETWAHRIGFPHPLEATLSYEGIGGVRHATFEGGLLFIETVNEWNPNNTLAFSIHADTASIPPTTLDEHVTIGGPYFDVLNGRYEIEQLPAGRGVILHLSSEERLTTTFNLYAGLWSDSVMRTLQQSILEVIKHPCEITPR